MRVDQIQPEVTAEYQLAEAGLMPPSLPGFLCYPACFIFYANPDVTTSSKGAECRG